MSISRLAKIIIAITTVSASIMELIDTSIVNVALNQMAGNLGASIEDVLLGNYLLCHCECDYHSDDQLFVPVLRAQTVLYFFHHSLYGCLGHVRFIYVHLGTGILAFHSGIRRRCFAIFFPSPFYLMLFHSIKEAWPGPCSGWESS